MIPEGFVKGRLSKYKCNLKSHKKGESVLRSKRPQQYGRGTHFYTNGIVNIRAKECPQGFKKGRTMNKLIGKNNPAFGKPGY